MRAENILLKKDLESFKKMSMEEEAHHQRLAQGRPRAQPRKENFIDKIKKIFDFIFSKTDIIVYEDYSRYNSEIRQFHNTEVLFKAYTIGQDLHGNRSIVLALYSPSVMVKPIIDKIDLGKGEFRYNIEGWPIIRLHLGGKYKMMANFPIDPQLN